MSRAERCRRRSCLDPDRTHVTMAGEYGQRWTKVWRTAACPFRACADVEGGSEHQFLRVPSILQNVGMSVHASPQDRQEFGLRPQR